MRTILLAALLALIAACAQPAQTPAKTGSTPPDQAAGSSAAGATLAVPITARQAIGSWVINEPECATDGGVFLGGDGEAYFGGPGLWAIDPQGRVMIVYREQEMGMDADPYAPRHVVTMTFTSVSEQTLAGSFEDGEVFNAHRCPNTQADADRARLPN